MSIRNILFCLVNAAAFFISGAVASDAIEVLPGVNVKPNFEKNTIEYTIPGLDAYKTVELFAKCGALLDIYARTLTDSESDYTNHGFHQRELGLKVSSYYIAQSAGYEPNLYDSFFKTSTSTLMLEMKHTESPELDTYLQEELKDCAKAGPLQSFLVEMMHEQAYKKK